MNPSTPQRLTVKINPSFWDLVVLVLTAPFRGFAIPLRLVDDPNFFDDLRVLAGSQTDFGGPEGRCQSAA
ncbi:MAG TPA: hypothetical protein VMB21_19645 [Candidatus Limnocylindria bacterium]|jgi:hypothetical protein|nr:hypothetical protein [Candidatus Limnocylindria bacterium]